MPGAKSSHVNNERQHEALKDSEERVAVMVEELRAKIDEARRSADDDPYLQAPGGDVPDVNEGEQQAP